MFEEFWRLQPRDETGTKGMGLGLAIVQRMARALGHEIRVRSEVGRGSMFAVEVPIADAATAVVVEPPGTRPAMRVDEALVLCIDNEPTILEGMTALLEGWSCEVLTAMDSELALAVVARSGRTPDLLLADFHLNGFDTGLKAVAALRERWGEMPAVVITADYGEEIRERVREAGLPMLRKPVKPAALRAIMSQLLLARRRSLAATG